MAEQGIRSRRSLLLGFLLGVAFLAAGIFELQQLALWRSENHAVQRAVARGHAMLVQFPVDYQKAFGARPHAMSKLLSDGHALAALLGELHTRASSSRSALSSLANRWNQAQTSLNDALGKTAAIRANLDKTVEAVHAARIALPLYRVASRHLAGHLETIGAPVSQIVPVIKLEGQEARLSRQLQDFQHPRALFGRYVDHARSLATHMQEVTRGLAIGSRRLGIPPVTDPDLRPSIRSLTALFAPVARGVGLLVTQAPNLGPAEADWAAFASHLPLLESSTEHVLMMEHPLTPPFWLRSLYAYLFLGIGLTIFVMMFFGWRLISEVQQAQRGRMQEARRNQNAILQLLDELAGLADGDLTVQASVTEDITGAIADSVNYAVEQLRGLVRTINQTAVRIDDAARSTNATAQQLAQTANLQSRQIRQATARVTSMARSIEQVSTNAQQAAQVAQRSVAIAHRGADAVRATIEGMNSIRESIQETAMPSPRDRCSSRSRI